MALRGFGELHLTIALDLGPRRWQPNECDALLQGRDALVALQQAITTNDLEGGTLVERASSSLTGLEWALLRHRPVFAVSRRQVGIKSAGIQHPNVGPGGETIEVEQEGWLSFGCFSNAGAIAQVVLCRVGPRGAHYRDKVQVMREKRYDSRLQGPNSGEHALASD